MPRIKARCGTCGKVVSLLFDENESREINDLKEGEHFEHKCPLCDDWTAFEIVE